MIYWEQQQDDMLCGVHTVNSLLQGPFYNEFDLAQLGQDLDKKEIELMGADPNKFKSSNVGLDGNFSIQVLSEAIKILGIEEIQSVDAQINQNQDLSNENGFICNSQHHWFAIRKVGGIWYNLNSTNKHGPEIISDFYLSAFLQSVRENGYQIFVVKGVYPDPKQKQQQHLQFFQKLISQQKINAIHQKRVKKKNYQLNIGGTEDKNYKKAIKASLGQKQEQSSDSDYDLDGEDDEPQKQEKVIPFQGQGVAIKNNNKINTNYQKFAITRNADPEYYDVIMLTLEQNYINKIEDGIFIQFKMPEGKNLEWTFAYDATVDDLYDFVYYSIREKSYPFYLTAPYQKLDLLDVRDQLIELNIDSMTQIIVNKQ